LIFIIFYFYYLFLFLLLIFIIFVLLFFIIYFLFIFLGFEQDSQLTKTPNDEHDFPVGGHLHFKHNIVNNKWPRHNLEQKFRAENLDSVFTKS